MTNPDPRDQSIALVFFSPASLLIRFEWTMKDACLIGAIA